MKACGNMDVELHTFLTVAVDGEVLSSLQLPLLLGKILTLVSCTSLLGVQ